MNKKLLITITAGLFIFNSCKKSTDTTKVVKVPKLELIGTTAFSSAAGTGSYIDPGANLTDEEGGVTKLTSPTSSTVNLTTPGFYSATYEKKTTYGYHLSASRLVLVTNSPANVDYSGVYKRTSNGCPVNVKKVGPGLYTTDNVGGVTGNDSYIYPVYFGIPNASSTTVEVPVQQNPLGGTLFCSSAKLSIAGQDTIIEWVVEGSGYGTAVRKFVK